MIGVFVTFDYGEGFDSEQLAKVAEEVQGRFQGMPGLRYKFFTVDGKQRRAVNFYAWDSEEAARAFFTPELTERVTELYGVRPSIHFVDIAAAVEDR